jgi:hypothetical protein
MVLVVAVVWAVGVAGFFTGYAVSRRDTSREKKIPKMYVTRLFTIMDEVPPEFTDHKSREEFLYWFGLIKKNTYKEWFDE